MVAKHDATSLREGLNWDAYDHIRVRITQFIRLSDRFVPPYRPRHDVRLAWDHPGAVYHAHPKPYLGLRICPRCGVDIGTTNDRVSDRRTNCPIPTVAEHLKAGRI